LLKFSPENRFSKSILELEREHCKVIIEIMKVDWVWWLISVILLVTVEAEIKKTEV
jgi:hypothetical protein